MPFDIVSDFALVNSKDTLDFPLLEECLECPQATLTEARSSRMLVWVFIVNEEELLDRDDLKVDVKL